nr:alpha-2B adrenergic receptor-like [Biomphalaria glabrata]
MEMPELPNATPCKNVSVLDQALPVLSDSKAWLFAVSLSLSLLSAFTVSSNALVIAAVSHSYAQRNRLSEKKSYEKSNMKLLMASLAVGDAVIGGCFMPLGIGNIIYNGRWILSETSCRFFAMMDIVFCTSSIYHVMFMAVDRYLAICRPLFHRLLTIKSGLGMAGLSWGVPLMLVCLAFTLNLMSATHFSLCRVDACQIEIKPLYSIGGSVFTILLPFTVICVLYILVLLEVKRFHKRKPNFLGKERHNSISQTAPSSQRSNKLMKSKDISKSNKINETIREGFLKEDRTSAEGCLIQTISKFSSGANYEHDSSENAKSKIPQTVKKSGTSNSNKAFLTIGLLVFSFAVCWCPFAILLCLRKLGKGSDLSFSSGTVVVWLCYLNSAFNPVLFCCHRGMRMALKKLLKIGNEATKLRHQR